MPTQMTEPRDLFLHELRDVLHAEKVLEKALPAMADEASDDELRAGFENHLEETRRQITNIERAFEHLGESAKPERCKGIEGITAEATDFMKKAPSPEVCDLFLTGAGARAEHYEIAAYSGLIAMARAMGETDVAKLLDENLRQEKEALKLMEGIGKRMMAASPPTASS